MAWFVRQDSAVQVSTVAAALAGLSLIVSSLSMRTGRQALKLSKRQEVQRKANLVLEYSQASRSAAGENVLYTFQITVKNLSDAANALARADLRISYSIEGLLTQVAVPSVSEGVEILRDGKTSRMDLPVKIDGRTTVGGRIHFSHSSKLLAGRVVRGYQLVVTDTFDSPHVVDVVHMPEGGLNS